MREVWKLLGQGEIPRAAPVRTGGEETEMGDKLGIVMAIVGLMALLSGCDYWAAAAGPNQLAGATPTQQGKPADTPVPPEIPGGPERPPCNICFRESPWP